MHTAVAALSWLSTLIVIMHCALDVKCRSDTEAMCGIWYLYAYVHDGPDSWRHVLSALSPQYITLLQGARGLALQMWSWRTLMIICCSGSTENATGKKLHADAQVMLFSACKLQSICEKRAGLHLPTISLALA